MSKGFSGRSVGLLHWTVYRFDETSKTEVLQTPSAIKSKPRSGGWVVKVLEFLKKIEF